MGGVMVSLFFRKSLQSMENLKNNHYILTQKQSDER